MIIDQIGKPEEDTFDFEYDPDALEDQWAKDAEQEPGDGDEPESEDDEPSSGAPSAADFDFQDSEQEDDDTEPADQDDDGDEEEPKNPNAKAKAKAQDDGEDDDEEDEDVQETATFLKRLNSSGLIEITEDDLEGGGDVDEILQQKMLGYVNTTLDNHLKGLGQEEQQAALALLQGASIDEFKDSVDVPTVNYTKEDIQDSPDAAREVITKNLKALGRSEKEIARNLKAIDDDELEAEALEALKDLNKRSTELKESKAQKIAESKAARDRAQQEASQRIYEGSKKYFSSLKEFVPGKKYRKTTLAAVEAKVPEVINKVTGQLDKYGPVLAMLDHEGLLEGDFSKVTEVLKSRGNKKLIDELNKTKKTKKGVPSETQQQTRPRRLNF